MKLSSSEHTSRGTYRCRLQSEDYPLLAVYKLGAVVLFFAATVCVVIQGSASLPLSHGRAIICVPASVLSPWKL